MALNFGERYNIPSIALRYSIVQGSRQSFYNMYSGACRIFSLSYYFDKPPVVYEDGMMMRDFVNVHDVVDANILAMQDERTDYQAYAVGGGKAYSVKEFAEIVAKEFGKEKIKTPNYRRVPVRRYKKCVFRYFQIERAGLVTKTSCCTEA